MDCEINLLYIRFVIELNVEINCMFFLDSVMQLGVKAVILLTYIFTYIFNSFVILLLLKNIYIHI